jgi:hypothetical protein
MDGDGVVVRCERQIEWGRGEVVKGEATTVLG